MDDALARAVELGHIPTLANIQYFKALFELNRGHTEAARHDATKSCNWGDSTNSLPIWRSDACCTAMRAPTFPGQPGGFQKPS